MPRIWTRLFILTVLAVVLSWSVIGLAVRALQQANAVIIELDDTHVPALTQTSQLSVQIAELAIRSNEMLLATSISDSPIDGITDDLSQFLLNRLDDPALADETWEIVAQLEVVAQNLARMRRLEDDIRSHVTRLRWLNLELEQETTALVADFTFNIQAQIRTLVSEGDEAMREAKALFLDEETHRRDAFSTLASELTQLGSVALQVANVVSIAQLDQLEDILSDSLAEVERILIEEPQGSEFLTIRQSIEALEEVTSGPNGLLKSRQEWIALRDRVQTQLEQALLSLSDVQQGLQTDAVAQRSALSETITAFSIESSRKRSVLLVSIVAALAGGLGILFFYIRPVIIRPMQELTSAMNAIADGKSVDVSDVTNRNDEIGQLTNAVQTFHGSVRERDQAISKLKATQNELVQAGKMAALGNLSAGIGHELNQPLGAMKQRLHMLKSAIAGGDKDAQSRQTGKIEDLAHRMEQIIQHLKKFARRSEHLKETVPLLPLVKSATALMKTNLAERRITLVLDPALDEIMFLGDPVLVEQVIVNLLSNASDAIAETGQPGDIRVEPVDAPDGKIAFRVADTGVGLGDLDPVTVIEPFITSKNPGAGLGLGLSISYNILTGLGGDLALSAREGEGVRATVTLPAVQGTA
ncbi:MAG: hypothetical protein Rhims3KO_07340 [Hyphomicrobiales bacterium]